MGRITPQRRVLAQDVERRRRRGCRAQAQIRQLFEIFLVLGRDAGIDRAGELLERQLLATARHQQRVPALAEHAVLVQEFADRLLRPQFVTHAVTRCRDVGHECDDQSGQQTQGHGPAGVGRTLRVPLPRTGQDLRHQRATDQATHMGRVVDPRDSQAHPQGHQREDGCGAEQPAEFTPLDMPALAPQKDQQRTVQAEHRARRPARDRLVALQDQRQEVAGNPAAQIENREPPAAVQLFHQSADVPQGPHVEPQMHHAKVQEHRCRQPPPLPVLRGRAEIGTPGQLHRIGGVAQARAKPQHRGKDQHIHDDQGHGDGRFPGPRMQQVGQTGCCSRGAERRNRSGGRHGYRYYSLSRGPRSLDTGSKMATICG